LWESIIRVLPPPTCEAYILQYYFTEEVRAAWPLQHIVPLYSFFVGVHHPFIAPPPAKPTIFQYFCTTIAQYTTPSPNSGLARRIETWCGGRAEDRFFSLSLISYNSHHNSRAQSEKHCRRRGASFIYVSLISYNSHHNTTHTTIAERRAEKPCRRRGARIVYLSHHTTHTTTAKRRAEKQCRRRGASSGQTTKRGIEGGDPLYISHILQLTPQKLSAEPRNSASAEALAVARRPKEASREKTLCISLISYNPQPKS